MVANSCGVIPSSLKRQMQNETERSAPGEVLDDGSIVDEGKCWLGAGLEVDEALALSADADGSGL